jgi:Cu/Ag efflux pump CusA
MVKQYQVLLDPVKLAAYGVTHAQAVDAIQKANQRAAARCWRWPRPNIWSVSPAI